MRIVRCRRSRESWLDVAGLARHFHLGSSTKSQRSLLFALDALEHSGEYLALEAALTCVLIVAISRRVMRTCGSLFPDPVGEEENTAYADNRSAGVLSPSWLPRAAIAQEVGSHGSGF